MKTFKQYLKEAKIVESKSLNESWKDKTLENDCESFIMDMDLWEVTVGNQSYRWKDAVDNYFESMSDHFAYKELKGLNKIVFDDVKKQLVDVYKKFQKSATDVCKSLLKRLNDEYKISEEKEVIESYIEQIKNIQNNLK